MRAAMSVKLGLTPSVANHDLGDRRRAALPTAAGAGRRLAGLQGAAPDQSSRPMMPVASPW
jgi:hypothetical protein